jgi:hypothetical protein
MFKSAKRHQLLQGSLKMDAGQADIPLQAGMVHNRSVVANANVFQVISSISHLQFVVKCVE